jgi:addiction module HigA family antidote
MMSPRKRKAEICRRMLLRDHEAQELRLWDRMPPVGREFGSPDFERLMEEDHRNRVGVFDPALKGFGSGRLDKSSGRMQSPPHPGVTLRDDVLPSLGLTVGQAAAALDVAQPALSSVLNGEAPVSPELALRLERWLGVERGGRAEVWLGMQAAYDEWHESD